MVEALAEARWCAAMPQPPRCCPGLCICRSLQPARLGPATRAVQSPAAAVAVVWGGLGHRVGRIDGVHALELAAVVVDPQGPLRRASQLQSPVLRKAAAAAARCGLVTWDGRVAAVPQFTCWA